MKRDIIKHIVRKCRGVSLMEMILVVALFLLLISLGAPALSGGKTRSQVKSSAMILAEDLQAARQKAIDTQKPVAVVIPSNNGTNALSVGYYIMEGYDKPVITKSVNWKDTHPSSHIFTGFWDISSGTNTTAPPDPQANDFPFDLEAWGGTSDDYVFLFTPRGTVKTNGLPNFDNNFHLVITRGITYSMISLSSAEDLVTARDDSSWDDGVETSFKNPKSFGKIEKAWEKSNTITITPLGDVKMSDGILKWTGSFETGEPPTGTIRNPVEPPAAPVAQTNNPPQILEVEVLPHPNPHTLPIGANGTCPPSKHNSLIIKAKDQDGDQLFTRIKCNTLGSAPGGWGVSIPENVDTVMERTELKKNPDLNPVPEYYVRKVSNDVDTHVLETDWQPPSASNAGNRYEIEIEVKDQKGGKDTKKIVIEILPDEFITFTRNDGGGDAIYLMNSDGTGKMKIADGKYSDVNPNGKQIAVVNAIDTSLYLMNYDGTGVKLIQKSSSDIGPVTFSPDGTKIAYAMLSTSSPNTSTIYVVNSDGTDRRSIILAINDKCNYSHPGPKMEIRFVICFVITALLEGRRTNGN